MYLDAGEQEAITVARRLLAPYVNVLAPGEHDYKSRLQEAIQAAGKAPPTYALSRAEGPDHERVFHVEVRSGDAVLGAGSGRSKLQAEQLAAKDALSKMAE